MTSSPASNFRSGSSASHELERKANTAKGYEHGRSLGGEAFKGEQLVRHRFFDVGRRRGTSFPDLIEQPGLGRGRGPLSFRIVMGEAAGPEDHGAQFGGAAAPRVVEVEKRNAGPGHSILQERDCRRRRQAMLAAKMEQGADKAV